MTPPPPMTTVAQTPLLVGICGGRGLGDRVVDRRPNARHVGNRLRRMARRSARPGMAKSLGAQPGAAFGTLAGVTCRADRADRLDDERGGNQLCIAGCSNIPKSPTFG